MEADWEFDLGGDAPVMDARWAGFVDLRREPERARELAEVKHFPALAAALMRLNGAGSPVWTSKCDFWPAMEAEEFDADEVDAPPGLATHAVGCYIDLLANSDQQLAVPEMAAESCEGLCGRLRAVALRCCRVDLVVRLAAMEKNRTHLGITAYFTACGPDGKIAGETLEACLGAFADTLCGDSTLQLRSTGE
jgi:hypothetical protein